MMKKLYLLLVIWMLLGSLIALPAEYTRSGNPKLYKELKSKADKNIKTLPSEARHSYQKLFKEHQDILMAYLLAYESNVNLAAAAPETVASNYQAVAQLLDKEKFSYSPEFFLSYIARQSVSDEAIVPYRQALLEDGLQEVWDNNPVLLDRFRATTLWCVSRLQFQQTSGRDQTPLDITQRSLTGRCEEMQILLVAAARTVGLPSRPASTPWWAHMDNNHAWAEVFLDGAWHYTGDMDAAWFPDQTWFSGMIDKTVMILADGSLAAENDEVLSKGTYETLINSTRNYAKERTRMLKLKVLKPDGKPAAKATVIPMVFNWGSLRALAYLATDDQGYLEFSCGRGAFYLSLYQSGLQAVQFVPSSEDKELELEVLLSAQLPGRESQIMHYPANPMTWGNPPDSYRDAVKAEKQRWTDKNAAFQAQVEEILSPVQDSLAYRVALACKGNWPAFMAFGKQFENIEPEFYEFLLGYDPKFLWQSSSAQFSALYNFYRSQFPHLHGSEEENVLLSPTVFYEEIPQPWYNEQGEAQLYPAEFGVDGSSASEKVNKAIALLHKKHKIKSRKALSGLLPLQLATKQKYLTNYQFRILACSMLRANGIPADYSRMPDLITVFVDGDWEYYHVVKRRWEDRSTGDEGQELLLKVKLQDEQGIPIRASEEQMNLCRYVEGTFYPLVNRFEYLGQGWHQVRFKAQDAFLHFGYRISDSDTGFHQIPISATSQDTLIIEITAGKYPRTWLEADPQILAMLDEKILSSQELILIGNFDQENSLRTAEKLKAANAEFLWLGYQQSATPPANYRLLPAWSEAIQRDSHNAMRCITLLKKDGAWQMFEGLWDRLP